MLLLAALGEAIAALARIVSVMHDGGFIHGSLTAAHIYLRADNQEVVRIFIAVVSFYASGSSAVVLCKHSQITTRDIIQCSC
jgi:tRNA A-37 threonylcarbamoyl transferase component Bud32